MGQAITNAVGELIKRQHGTVSYTDSGREVIVTSKPAHYSLHVSLIDKEAQKRKEKSVRLDKTYTYPKEIESAVLWDALLEMRQAIIAYTGEQGRKSWNDTFGAHWPELAIRPLVTQPEQEFPSPPERRKNSKRETVQNRSERGFLFGAVRLTGYREKWQAYYRFDDDVKKYAGTFRSSVEAKEAAYEAATKAITAAKNGSEPAQAQPERSPTAPTSVNREED